MRPDLYTKALLTVIALLLLMIACNQYVSPATTASAQGPFAGLQYAGPNSISFLMLELVMFGPTTATAQSGPISA